MKKSLFLLLIVLLSSCSSKLTNEEASKIITENFIPECSNKLSLAVDTWNYDPVDYYLNIYKKLQTNNIITFKRAKRLKNGYVLPNDRRRYEIEINDEYEKYRRGDNDSWYFNVAKPTNIKIEGMQHTEEKTIVNFTYSLAPNELHVLSKGDKNGKIFNDCLKKKNKSSYSETVTFRKFDTGWQMERPLTETEKLMKQYGQ